MQSKLIKEFKRQKKIPIIGRFEKSDIFGKVKHYVAKGYNVIEIILRSEKSLEVSLEVKKISQSYNWT